MLEKFQQILGYDNKKLNNKLKKNNIILFIKIILIAVVFTLLINKFFIFKANVPTASMAPNININDKLLVTRVYNLDTLQFGDIVVFYSKEFNEYMVKRLIGLPGDFISMDEGSLYVNGEYKRESYIQNVDDYTGKFKVPDEEYFFLGDNRLISLDSRLWDKTCVNGQDIIGIVRFRIYPFKNIGSIK
ncbi:signal peptidase I [Clostridium gasigenes]|uniref:signal peptidase I n=1 Tax=Clostridium gasigenes TaxID=94869 RepID=UPI001C0CF42A|nr:signal peptidase I [Clostridium gasigenes]MBU3136885.1 signal peptidase I [Clostridium gasigenes]